ncbi:TauD/TfdA dioxygenase family protein [Halothiobacillus neapolitanus]|nr:TauD/TfdA family dioxygenase [Halothiobacillus neapolitanus]
MKNNVAVISRQVTEMTDDEIHNLKKIVFDSGIVVLKAQNATASDFVDFGRRIGELSPYYEEMYHHPNHKELFVSSNVQTDGKVIGVPRTGKFWHADYAFMAKPFAFTITYPQVVSSQERGTYFIDMASAYERLSPEMKRKIEGGVGTHSVRRYFKIRPTDVYRPISEILHEIDAKTPTVTHPLVVNHPVTGAKILYVSRGFTETISLKDDDLDADEVLKDLLVESGQSDDTFTHPDIRQININEGDIFLWDNRRYVHHAKHNDKVEPTKTYRLTAYDGLPFSAEIDFALDSVKEVGLV